MEELCQLEPQKQFSSASTAGRPRLLGLAQGKRAHVPAALCCVYLSHDMQDLSSADLLLQLVAGILEQASAANLATVCALILLAALDHLR